MSYKDMTIEELDVLERDQSLEVAISTACDMASPRQMARWVARTASRWAMKYTEWIAWVERPKPHEKMDPTDLTQVHSRMEHGVRCLASFLILKARRSSVTSCSEFHGVRIEELKAQLADLRAALEEDES